MILLHSSPGFRDKVTTEERRHLSAKSSMKFVIFQNLSIRAKLLYGYLTAFLFVILIGNFFLYSVVRSTIERNIESELNVSTKSILNMVRTAVNTAIRSNLRGLGDAGLQVVQNHYNRHLAGEITEAEAKQEAASELLAMQIGKSGYFYGVNSLGIMQFHPENELIGKNLSEHDFIIIQKRQRHGYIEYNWANPGEDERRAKALYMNYFAPWDWIISVSSYRDEFKELINLEDFRARILAITFGKTGYPYVMDSRGNLIIHPKLEGTNIFDSQDSSGRRFIEEICERKNGHIIYPWQNPGEPTPREKLVYFNYIPEMDWIVASSSYLEEFYAPLKAITLSTLSTVLLIFVLIILITWRISASITKPLQVIMQRFAHGAEGKFDSRLDLENGGEVGQLARYYNTFMDRLEASSNQLRNSEENYRKLFENAAEGIFRADGDGRFISVNPATAEMLGFPDPSELLDNGAELGRLLFKSRVSDRDGLDILHRRGKIEGFETPYYTEDGTERWFAINARLARDSKGDIQHIEGFMSDITDRKLHEEQQQKTQAELERRVEERTAELSNWVQELERSNDEGEHLREMGQMLQSCRTEAETIPVIKTYLQRFFPDDHVSLFQTDKLDREQFKVTVQTGNGHSRNNLTLYRDDCWALRQGKTHTVFGHEPDMSCPHFSLKNNQNEFGSICIPLIAQEELTGLLSIECLQPYDDGEQAAQMNPPRLSRKNRLAVTIAEHLALALANLRLRETLHLQSIQDPLTGLFNRRYFDQFISREASRMKRLATTHGIIMADLDMFKIINDSFGHEAGDEVLKVFSSLLLANIREGDVACRLGGEEFLLVLMDVSIEDATGKAQELCDAVRALDVIYEGHHISFTVSMGVGGWPMHGESIETVLQIADTALYSAKKQGRDKVIRAPDPAKT